MLLASTLACIAFLLPRKETSRGTPENIVHFATSAESGDVNASKSNFPGGQIFVYYATQTGTAESFARQIEREAPEHGFSVQLVDLEDVSLEALVAEDRRFDGSGTARAIFLTATYGEGEAPDNAVAFVQSLTRKAAYHTDSTMVCSANEQESCLVGLDYSVFGLGNRQYDHFNAMGKLFDHCLEKAGGTRVVDLGLGDDDNDLEADFENWKDKALWPTLEKLYVSGAQRTPISCQRTLPDCKYIVKYLEGSTFIPGTEVEEAHGQSKHFFSSSVFPVKVVRELRSADDTSSTVHIELDIEGNADFKYQTADNLGVIPENEARFVDKLASRLGYNLNQLFSVAPAPGHDWNGAPFPSPITVREFLTRYCDLTGPLRRLDLKVLAAYASSATDRSALLRMSSKEGKAEFKEKILANYIGLVDLLQLCPSVTIPFDHFLSVCSMLQTRFFTIASSSSVYPNSIHLTVAVTRDMRRNGDVFKGLCSNYLSRSRPGISMLRVYTRPSSFRLPDDSRRPIVMIGPGTGIAPMRALIQERAYQRKIRQLEVGPNILYFGCRGPNLDFLYENELKAFRAEGDLAQLHVAFSRMQSTKCYVQHLLSANAEDTWTLISQSGAHIYVCGGVKMGHDIADALRDIFCTEGKMNVEAAKDYLSALAKGGRYVQELWA